MNSSGRFKHQMLALFFIVSLVPAVVVAGVWYVITQIMPSGSITVSTTYGVIAIFLIGLVPALILSLIFAELLARPIQRLHLTARSLAAGHYHTFQTTNQRGELSEIGHDLNKIGEQLERALSEKTSENALIIAERNKLSGVLNSMTDGVFALDRSGRIILFNHAAAHLTGHTITEVAGQLAEKVIPLRLNGELIMARWLATHSGEGEKIGQWKELELYRADGTSLFVGVQAIVLPEDPNGIRALITFHDLTRDHQLEEMKFDFVALAAHELRTPITELSGYLDMLGHEAKKLSHSDREFLDHAILSAAELSGLVTNLLNVARIEHDEANYHPVPFDYLSMVKSCAKLFKHSLAERNLTLVLEIPPHLPMILADPVGIKEVLRNLISNAANYTQAPGTITLRVTKERSEIETTVTDTGTGIPSQAIPRLFTKFYRVEGLKARTRGTGLGLYICKSIIDAHGGHIWVESVEGRGSTFGFRLPSTTRVAQVSPAGDNDISISRGPHGWIKTNTNR